MFLLALIIMIAAMPAMPRVACPHSRGTYPHQACSGKGCAGCDNNGVVCRACKQPPTRNGMIDVP